METGQLDSDTAALAQIGAGVLLADASGRIRFANAAFARLAGRSVQALCGQPLASLVEADDGEAPGGAAPPALHGLDALRAGSAETCRLELRWEHDDGRNVWADICASARRDAGGAFDGFTLVALDITDSKRRQALRRQRESLALQAAGLGLWEWHPPSGAWQVDPYWAMTLGYSVTELVAHVDTLKALEHADDRAAIESAIGRCLSGESAEYSGEHRLRHKLGHWVWMLDHGMVVERDRRGRPTRVLGTSQDVTQRKLAEAALLQSRQRQALALSSARLGQWEWDIESGAVRFDERFAEIVGYRLDELAPDRSTWKRIDHPDDAPALQARLQAHLRGDTPDYHSEHRVRHKLGHDVWVCGTGLVIERDAQGRALRMVGLHQDISERKRHEIELSEAKDAADAANRAKSGFLANMSHEIRTPMNAMLGLTRLVLDTELTPRQRDFLQKVYASSKSLLSLLNDVLDYSKIEAGRMTLEHIQFPLEEPLNNVASLFGAQVEQKGLELFFEVAPDVPMEVVGDPLRFTQVLNNLVGNAIKFTERGEIRIKTEVVEREGDAIVLRVAVSDTGIGLSAEHAAQLFNAFTQADESVTRRYGGTGLGLTISRQLVQLMGGEISVHGVPGEGCTFTFTLRVQAASTEHLTLDLHRVRGLRALVVDDQETSRLILQSLFHAWGLQVDAAASAEDGLALIERSRADARPYDVVLLDWRMPGMNGVEMARRMRAAGDGDGGPAACPPFAIMVTAFGREQLLAEAGELPLDAVLTKPVVPSSLFDILMRLRSGLDGALPALGNGVAPLPRFDGTRVLLVEDNPLNQQVASEFLAGIGAQVTVAQHGREAVEQVARAAFDIVLMDLHMPVMGGADATLAIRAMPNGRDLPIVAMTAAVLSEDREHCRRVGMVDFVAKPVDPDELVRVLRCWVPTSDAPDGTAERPAPAAPRPGAPNVATWPALPGFSIEAALRLVHGNPERLAQLLLSFARQHETTAARIDTLLAGGDAAQAQRELHTLRGSAATLGLGRIAALALQIESALSAGTAHPSCEALAAGLGETLDAIAALAPDDAGAGTPPDPAALRALLDELARYLREGELLPDELLDTLKTFAVAVPPTHALRALRRHVLDFDHEAALAQIATLAAALATEPVTTP